MIWSGGCSSCCWARGTWLRASESARAVPRQVAVRMGGGGGGRGGEVVVVVVVVVVVAVVVVVVAVAVVVIEKYE